SVPAHARVERKQPAYGPGVGVRVHDEALRDGERDPAAEQRSRPVVGAQMELADALVDAAAETLLDVGEHGRIPVPGAEVARSAVGTELRHDAPGVLLPEPH